LQQLQRCAEIRRWRHQGSRARCACCRCSFTGEIFEGSNISPGRNL
jgi:hypothetical protein